MNRIKRPFLIFAVCMGIAVAGCSTAWVGTLDNILVAAAPALLNILNIIAIAKGQPVNTALASKITQDAATVKVLSADFASASAAAAPNACAQLQSAIGVYSQDQSQVMALAQISDPATQSKVEVLSSLVVGTIAAVEAVIPSCQAAPATKLMLASRTAVPVPLGSFVSSYNRELVVPVGNPSVDAFTKSHKIHVHSKFVRMISLGFAQ